MNRFSKTAITGAACAALLSLQFSAVAGPGKGERHRPGDAPTTRVLERLSQKLELTEEQKAKVAAILATTAGDLKAEAGQAKDVLQKTREEIAATLTDEQKKKLEEMKGNVRDGVGGFMQAHGPEMKERLQHAGEEVRMRMALSSLDLTAEQKEKLQAVQKDIMEKRRALQEEMRPKMEAIQQEAKAQVTAVLTDEQKQQLQKKLEEMPKPGAGGGERFRGAAMEKMKERHAEGMRPGGKGGPRHKAPQAGGGDPLMDLFR